MDQIQTQPTPVPTPPVAPVLPTSKPKNHIVVSIILGLIILGVGITGGFILGKQRYTVPQPNPVPTPSPIVIATPTPDPTANWKMYTNTKYGYSISYPVSYVLTNIADGGTGVVPQNAENISISESSNIKYEDRLMDLRHLGLLVDISPADQWQKTSVTIAGVKSTKFTKIDKLSNFDYYHIPTKGTEGIELMINNKQQIKVDQILSTFKFIN